MQSESTDSALNVTMVNQILRSNNVTVTLQWPRDGAVYHVNVLPKTSISHTVHECITTSHYVCTTNLTISYDTQYNVSIVSSLCGVTTTKMLHYGK